MNRFQEKLDILSEAKWSVSKEKLGGDEIAVVRRDKEVILTANLNPNTKDGFSDIDFSDPSFQKSNQTRQKAIAVLRTLKVKKLKT